MMATRKAAKKLSHPIEVLREVSMLKDAERRLRGIARGLGIAENVADMSGLRQALHQSIVTEARSLVEIAERLNGLLGADAAKLDGAA